MTATLPIIPDPSAPALPPGLVLPRFHLHHPPRGGPSMLTRSLPIPLGKDAAMRSLWSRHKMAFTERGFKMKNESGKWVLEQWVVPDAGACRLCPYGVKRLEALRQPRLDLFREPPPPPLVLEALPGWIEERLLDYQVEPARQLYRALTHGLEEWGYPGAWDCSDTGTGKTYVSLAAALATGKRVGVVCPRAVIGTLPSGENPGSGWAGAFHHFGKEPLFIRNFEKLRTGNDDKLIVATGNPKRPFRWVIDRDDTVILWDEAQNIANRSLNRSLCFAALREGIPMICASATLADSPLRLGATGVVAGLHRGDLASYELFLAEHACQKLGTNKWVFPKTRAGAVALAKIHRTVFPRRGVRIRIADLGDKFQRTDILCEAFKTHDTEAISAAFAKAQGTIRNLEKQGKNPSVLKRLEQLAYMEAWHTSERIKVPAIAEMARAEVAAGRSVLIFCSFDDVRVMLCEALDCKCTIHGKQRGVAGKRERDAHIADFQADRERILVANIAAGGTGVSLHDVTGNHPRTSIILPNPDATKMKQCFGRPHRAGGKTPSKQIVFFAKDTLEDRICAGIRAKIAAIDTINSGDLYPQKAF